MFRTETRPMIGSTEVQAHIQRCNDLWLSDAGEVPDDPEAAVHAMRCDMALLLGMTIALLAAHEIAPRRQPDTER